MELTLSDAIADYIEQRKQTKLEPLQKARDKVLAKNEDVVKIAKAKAIYAEASAPIEETFKPEAWLSDAARRAKQISLATHAAKFTNSDAKASSILVNVTNTEQTSYVVTANLSNKAIDAVGNAAALDVAKLLKISVNGESLINQLQQKHVSALKAFTGDANLLSDWQTGFEKALGDEKLAGHTLTKQLYFPVQDQSDYHLLCPLFSSLLAHELHQQVTGTRFGDSKEVREARKKGLYHESLDQSFPETAVQNFGGSKPQNISQLNSERYGQSFLLNCAPPTYQAQMTPPLTSSTIFNRQFGYKTSGMIREFKVFLTNLGDHERNFNVRYKRDYGFVLPLIDALLNHAVVIQNMTAGWGTDHDCQLKSAHVLWLDVYNPNEKFQIERAKGDWLEVVAHDFASWLIGKLKHDSYVMGDIEHGYFKKLCLAQLKSFERNTPKRGEV